MATDDNNPIRRNKAQEYLETYGGCVVDHSTNQDQGTSIRSPLDYAKMYGIHLEKYQEELLNHILVCGYCGAQLKQAIHIDADNKEWCGECKS